MVMVMVTVVDTQMVIVVLQMGMVTAMDMQMLMAVCESDGYAN